VENIMLMRAIKEHTYATRRLLVGETFEVTRPRDVKLLRALRRARASDEPDAPAKRKPASKARWPASRRAALRRGRVAAERGCPATSRLRAERAGASGDGYADFWAHRHARRAD
jgi:hypothetical protein